MKPRKHRNSKRRLTAAERALALCHAIWDTDVIPIKSLAEERDIIQRALAAHARQALRRDDRRDGKARP